MDFINLDCFVFWLYIHYPPHKEARYILPIALPILLVSSKGYIDLFAYLRNKSRLLILVLFFIFLIYSFLISFNTLLGDWVNTTKTTQMEVSDYILSLGHTHRTIFTKFNWPVYAYYSGMKVNKYHPDHYVVLVNPQEINETSYFIYQEGVEIKDYLDKNFNYLNKINDVYIYEYVYK